MLSVCAVQAANLTVPAGATWTVFAPTDAAFASGDIKKKTGLTAAQLLERKNKDALVKVRVDFRSSRSENSIVVAVSLVGFGPVSSTCVCVCGEGGGG